MNMKSTLVSLTALLFLAPALPVHAQPQCAPRATVLQHLADNFGETRQVIGMAQENRVMEVFASSETGSWTITITLPNGLTCLVVAGEGFEHLTEELRPAGTQS